MGRVLFLEPFDQPETPSPDAPPSEEWSAGHAAGLAEGTSAANSQQAALHDKMVQALADLAFTYAEARVQVLSSLTPLIASIIDTFLPAMARDAVVAQVTERILAAAREDSAAPMRITVAPAVFPALQACLATDLPLPLVLESDASLSPGQAMILHRGQETALDIDLLARETGAILGALYHQTEGKLRHG